MLTYTRLANIPKAKEKYQFPSRSASNIHTTLVTVVTVSANFITGVHDDFKETCEKDWTELTRCTARYMQ